MERKFVDILLGAAASRSDTSAAGIMPTADTLNTNVFLALKMLFFDSCFISVTSFDDILFEYHGDDGNAVAIAYSNATSKLQLAQWDALKDGFVSPDVATCRIPIFVVGLLHLFLDRTEGLNSVLADIASSKECLLAEEGETCIPADIRSSLANGIEKWLEGRLANFTLDIVLMEKVNDQFGHQADNAAAQLAFAGLLSVRMPEEREPAWFFRPGGPPYGPPSFGEESSMSVHVEELRRELLLDTHELSEYERTMIAQLEFNYVPDERIIKIARIIKEDWHLPLVDLAPNIILEGDSGSGKTAATKFLSYVWGLPRTKMTMSPTFESANLIGAFYPVIADIAEWRVSEKDKEALATVQELVEDERFCESGVPQRMDVITALRRALASPEARESIRGCYNIPTPEEVSIAPEIAWKRLGGDGPVPDADSVRTEADRAFEDVMYRLLTILTEKAQEGAVRYQFIESELMRAFRYGWLVEIQEAASVLRPGVLTELNSLLEPCGSIELPNGERIYRHPDTVVIITSNRDYIGNMDLNESLRDRCVLGEKMDLPPAEVMAERVMAQTGFKNRKVVREAVNVICAVNEIAHERNVRGTFGMRSLIGWVLDLKRGDFSVDAFKRRVIYKMTTRDEDVELLMDAYESVCSFVRTLPSDGRHRA